MKCPHCESDQSKVIDTRSNEDGIRRRRQCLGCRKRYSTMEYAPQSEVAIIKAQQFFRIKELTESLTTILGQLDPPTTGSSIISKSKPTKDLSKARATVNAALRRFKERRTKINFEEEDEWGLDSTDDELAAYDLV
ncbi:MAG: hypothetical protein AAF485_01990 [Chloroflexota bacterium]